jgi:hypothetical protein
MNCSISSAIPIDKSLEPTMIRRSNLAIAVLLVLCSIACDKTLDHERRGYSAQDIANDKSAGTDSD